MQLNSMTVRCCTGWKCLFGHLVALVPLVFLWQSLIRHLAVEWSLNPRYTYGWAVPGLCAYLICRNWRRQGLAGLGEPCSIGQLRTAAAAIGLALALGYAPLRLIQEANPEWRLVSWWQALEVLGLTFVLIFLCAQNCQHSAKEPSWVPFWFFPILFFLTAVPWPTLIENTIVRGLTSSVSFLTAEILGWLGVPALLYGNIIEVSEGRVAIEEGCSGIRSIQVSLMLALFFGQVHELSCARRVLCVVGAATLSLLTNLMRTVLLTLLTAKFGMEVLSNWHDRGGVPLLVALFVSVWVLAFWLRPRKREQSAANNSVWRYSKEKARQPAGPSHSGVIVSLPLALLVWLGLVEVFTEAWYRSHEKSLPASVVWRIEPPRDAAGFRELELRPEARRFLRFDEGVNATWSPTDETRCQAIFLSWKPGSVAAQLARNHTPEDCLVSGGYNLVASSETLTISVQGLELPFRSYSACGKAGLVYVFYCLWEDRATQHSAVERTWLTYHNRLGAVLAGKRNSGQRSLEVALWGVPNEEQARSTLTETLNQLIKVVD